MLRHKTWTENEGGKSSQCPKMNFERPSQTLENYSSRHFKKLEESVASWKLNINKSGVAQNFCKVSKNI